MGDIMRPVSFKQLLCWITEEYRSQWTIFEIPESQFFIKEMEKVFRYLMKVVLPL